MSMCGNLNYHVINYWYEATAVVIIFSGPVKGKTQQEYVRTVYWMGGMYMLVRRTG